MLQHVADDEGQILLGDDFLLVAQFCDTLCHLACLLWCQFESEFLEVLGDIGLTAVLAEGIFTASAETLWHEFVLVESVFLVTIGMHACDLGEDIVADDRLIRCDGDAAITLHEA